MQEPDVMVTVEGGVAQVDVFKTGIVVEVRDFDVEGADEDDEHLWTNEEGDRCWRYFVAQNDPKPQMIGHITPRAGSEVSGS